MFLVDDVLKGLAARSAGKEAKRAGEQEATGQFNADKANFSNNEASRTARVNALMSGLGMLSGGKYAGLLGNTASLTGPRKDPSFKHAVQDPSKGAMWGAVGNGLTSLGQLGLSALGGSALKLPSAANPTSLRNPNGSAPMSAEDEYKKFGESF